MKRDLAVIGAGPGGYAAAIKAAQEGLNVVIIEKGKIGGTCLNWGCIPTKALIKSGHLYRDIKEAANYGIEVAEPKLQMEKVQQRKQQIIDKMTGGVESLLLHHRVDIVQGEAQFLDKNIIAVGEEKIEADKIIIATGSKAKELNIPGSDLKGVINSKEALALDYLPEELLIIGAGIIGMEFAFLFANMGVKVKVLEYLDRILLDVDTEISSKLKELAEARGIEIYNNCEVSAIQEDGSAYQVHFKEKDEEKALSTELVLQAVGREASYGNCGIDKLGIKTYRQQKGIVVNTKMQTNIPGIYAIGDVTAKLLLAHTAFKQAEVAVKDIIGEEAEIDYRQIPAAIFTDPEIATVGWSEDEAREMGLDYSVGTFPYQACGRAATEGKTEGMIKIISSEDQILGASIIGFRATDLIAELTLALQQELSPAELAEAVHAHPTTAEVVHEAALDLGKGALHYP